MRTRKYMNGKRRRISPLRQDEEEKLPSGAGLTGQEVYQIKKLLNPKPDIFSRGWTDKQVAEYIDHVRKTQQPGGYHATEYQKGHKKRTKKLIREETKTKSTAPRIPLGKTEYTPFYRKLN